MIHPNSREERRKLRELHETEERKVASTRRRLKEELKAREAEDALKAAATYGRIEDVLG